MGWGIEGATNAQAGVWMVFWDDRGTLYLNGADGYMIICVAKTF